MSVSIAFHGAAGTVTGSSHLVRWPRGSLLVDCGMFQGSKSLKELNYGDFGFDPKALDAVLLTHAHIDHSGLLPKLTKRGYRGRIWATEPTRDLLRYMLPDSAYIQETEVAQLNRRNRQRGRPEVEPIYTGEDAEICLTRIKGVDYDSWVEVADGARARFWNAGHLLGSASIELEVDGGGPRPMRLLFSGDLGSGAKAFHDAPEAPESVDAMVLESTYGDREKVELTAEERRAALRDEVAAALGRGGNLIIPAFAVERTQELLHDLIALADQGAIPKAQIFIDSPLAVRATEVFAKHLAEELGPDALTRANVHYVLDVAHSKKLNQLKGGAIILAASGMCEAGRIRHHLKNQLWRANATVLLVGYQAQGTLGRLLQEGASRVRIHGEEIEVAARIRTLDVYSGHADRSALLEWAKARGPVKGGTFLVHGDPGALESLRLALVAEGFDPARTIAPDIDQTYVLRPDAAPELEAKARRRVQTAPQDGDWHNDYAAAVLELSEKLRAMPDDAKRRELLARLRRELAA